MDAFSLAFSYGINKLSKKSVIITAMTVGLFHFFMPLIGNFIGISIFDYTIIKPRYVMFFIFLLLSIDMFTHFFEEKPKIRTLNLIGTLIFSFSVSFDSLSVGIGLSYLCNNLVLALSTFCIITRWKDLHYYKMVRCKNFTSKISGKGHVMRKSSM